MQLGWEHPQGEVEDVLHKLLAANKTTLDVQFTQGITLDYCYTNKKHLFTMNSCAVEFDGWVGGWLDRWTGG